MSPRNSRFACMCVFILSFVFCLPTSGQQKTLNQPNILWITSEDNGPELGCYGDTFATTPHIDALAARGMMYESCWSNAPVCAPARTTIISGMFPTSLGGQHMRSEVKLPSVAKLYPEYLRGLGYYCTNNSKTDYNVIAPKDLWHESSKKAHWRNRKQGQPFFAVFNFTVSHESKIRKRPHNAIHEAKEVFVPPYHPDTPEVRQDWAQYYDIVTQMDREVGRVLQQLKDDELDDNTIVFYYGDHGSGMPRGKRWLYQSGLRVPLIVHVPERLQHLVEGQYEAGTTSKRLVSFVDLVPTVLSLLGAELPNHLHGKAFLGPKATEDPDYIYGFRDRMDERIDMSRAVRDQNYLYIRNFYPARPQGAYLDYMFQTPTTKKWKELFDAGKLNVAQSVFWKPKAPEELYDLSKDPYQVNNLADQEEHQGALERLRNANREWMLRVGDLGLLPEGEMHKRASDGAPNDLLYDEKDAVDVESLYAAADLATRPTQGDLDELLHLRTASDSAARYWLAQGLLLRAPNADGMESKQLTLAARGLASDVSPYVRCAANEILARYGNAADRKVAISQLLKLADSRNDNVDLFVSMCALNCLDWSSPTRAEVGEALVGVPGKDLRIPKRYHSYVPKLLKRVSSISQ